jgi:hypothetical protein
MDRKILIIVSIVFSSCCKNITETSTTKIDTLYVYKTDTVTIHETDTFRAEFNVDSLLDILNKPTNRTLSTSTHRGVTTRLSVRDGKLVCESTIDSLQAVIQRLETTINTKTVVVKKVEVKRPDTFFQKLYKWTFWILVVLIIGWIGGKYFSAYIPKRPKF